MRILIGLIVLAVLAFFGYRMYQDKATQEAVQQAGIELSLDQPVLGAQLKGLIDSATTTLGKVTDQASAQAALPSMDELKGKVDGLAAQVDQLPAEGKKLLAGMVSAALPPLKELAAKASSIQGGETIKPALDAVIAKLESWANAPT